MAEVTANGVALHVQVLGDGRPPVVFLHGLVMDNLSSWYFTVANAVATRRQAILHDLRGHGMSARPPSGYGLDAFVDDLAALLAALSVEGPVTLVGNSFGGLLALAFAAAHPARTGGLALVDALLPDPGWGDAMAATLSLSGSQRDETIARAFAPWLGRHSDRKRNRLASQAEALVSRTTLLPDLRASRSLAGDELAAIACPALLVYGAASDQRRSGERLAALLPRATLELLPGCSHSVLWEETARVRQLLLDFTTSERP